MPSSNTYKVVSPRAGSSPNLQVQELIDPNECCWNYGILENLFLPFEVDIIKTIPLSNRLSVDKLNWAETQNGFFTVRCAYKVAMDLSSNSTSSSSSYDSHLCKFWKQL